MHLDVKEFHLKRSGIHSILGDLETELMEIIWERKKEEEKEFTNRELLKILNRTRKKPLVVSTINITMTRLYRKGLIDRRLESIRGGHHYLYRATMTKSMFIDRIGEQILIHLQNCFGDAILRNFVGTIPPLPLSEDL